MLVIEGEISSLIIVGLCTLKKKKNVAENIDIETIISHNNFKIWKLMKGNCKTLCICVYFYFVMLIYSSFIFIKFF